MEYDELKYKNCLFCEHFNFSPGMAYDYSEVTPGDDVEIYCGESVWRLDVNDDNEDILVGYMLTARTCEKFEERKVREVSEGIPVRRKGTKRLIPIEEGYPKGTLVREVSLSNGEKFVEAWSQELMRWVKRKDEEV